MNGNNDETLSIGEEQSIREHAVHALVAAATRDPRAHPERSALTLGRVKEVIGLVIPDAARARQLAGECEAAAGTHDPRAALSSGAELSVVSVLCEALDSAECADAARYFNESELSTEEVLALHREYKIPVSHLEDDLLPVAGHGAMIRDSRGRSYVDLDSNYSATNLGNANVEIARGLYNQATLLISQKEDRIQVARARFLKEIGPMMPGDLTRFYWQNSGGEAVDKTIKIAKAYTGQTGVVAFERGFHGRTHGAVAVTHNVAYRRPFGLDNESWVHFAPFNDLEAVESFLSSGEARIVILELVQGEEAGIRPATPEFATGLRELCDRYEAVMIADEVQTGFGRVAQAPGQWFASHVYGVVPDIMAIGKSFGGGYPVTAVVTRPHISEAMKPGYDGSTFGGNPMAMTAALIATRQMRRLDVTARTVERSRQFAEGLERIDSPVFRGFRAVGLMIGIDLDSAERVAAVQTEMKKHGAHSSLSTGSTMRWMPPLVISAEQVERVLAAFSRALGDVG